MDDSKEQRQFTKDLIDAGYKNMDQKKKIKF